MKPGALVASVVVGVGLLAGLVVVFGGWTIVDSTEHCVLTRYGRVVERKMDTGLNFTPFANATCFSMTEQNFPRGAEEKETMEAQTRDPVTVLGDVAIVYSYDPGTIFEVFMEKRSPDAVETEIRNSIREGYRNALSGWTVAEIFSARRPTLADSVRSHIQRKVGNRANIQQVFVRDIKIPEQIERQRIAAAEQAQILDRAQKQFVIDSVNAAAQVIKARGEAEAKQLQARSYEANPRLIELDMIKAWSTGIGEACKGVQSCVLGGSVVDSWRGGVRQ
ncbi:MAG TPA: SPFH domain-containing protein [Longimicrobiaceae bacterium]|nr:SPFH domain-containing protein [Longimicrobiaceae bacterium]